MIPVEPIEGLGGAEGSGLDPAGEVSRLALALLEGALRGGGLGFRGVREPCFDGGAGGADADLAQELDEIGGVTHRSLRGREG